MTALDRRATASPDQAGPADRTSTLLAHHPPRPRDVLEATAWSRRRLAAALVAGSAGASGVAAAYPSAPRTLVGGALLALLVLGVAVGLRALGWTR